MVAAVMEIQKLNGVLEQGLIGYITLVRTASSSSIWPGLCISRPRVSTGLQVDQTQLGRHKVA